MHFGLCLFSLLGLTQAQRWVVPDLLNVVSSALNVSQDLVSFPIVGLAQKACANCSVNCTAAVSATSISDLSTIPLEFGMTPTFCARNNSEFPSGRCLCPPGQAMVSLRCTVNCTEINGTCLSPALPLLLGHEQVPSPLWRLSENFTNESATGIFCPTGSVLAGIECLSINCASLTSLCRTVEMFLCEENMDYDSNFTCLGSFVGSVRTTSVNESVKLPLLPFNQTAIYEVVWGDGALFSGNDSHTFALSGDYKFKIKGKFYLSYEMLVPGVNSTQLLSIESWGGFNVHPNYTKAFQGCENLQVSASDQPIFLPNTSLDGFFTDCKTLNTMFSWDLTNVVSLRGMFQGAKALNSTINFNSSSNVRDMSKMFMRADNFNSLLILDTSNVINMSSMFQEAFAFNQPISFDTANVETMSMMFLSAVSLNQDLQFNTSKLQDSSRMFAAARNFNGVPGIMEYTNVQTIAGMFAGASSFNRSFGGTMPAVRTFEDLFNSATSFDSTVILGVSSNLTSVKNMFKNASRFNHNVHIVGSGAITTTQGMFNGASDFNQNFTMNTSSVADMSFMFANTASFDKDISFSMESVVSTAWMFANATAFNSQIPTNTPLLTDMTSMFQGATMYNQMPALQTSSVVSMAFLFASAHTFNQDVVFDTRNVETMESMFNDAVSFDKQINLNTVKVTTMRNMFAGAAAFNQLLSIVTQNVIDMSGMFQRASNFSRSLSLNTSNVQNMNFMFEGAINFDSALNFDTQNVINMTSMFQNTASFDRVLTFNTAKVINMDNMFKAATALTRAPVFQTGNVQTMAGMFESATSFNSSLGFNTSQVLDMTNMFCNATVFGASAFNQPISFDTSSVSDMGQMFAQARSFNQIIRFSDTSKVQRFNRMFEDASSFNQPIDFNTGNALSMLNMFKGAEKFNQPLFFDTRLVTTMSQMFLNASNFMQDVSFWDTRTVGDCQQFCDMCGLPTFVLCLPCPAQPLASRSYSVCTCPPGEFVVVDHCANETAAPTPTPLGNFTLAPSQAKPVNPGINGKVSVPYSNTNLTVNVSGVEVGLPSDPKLGGNGTFVISVSNSTSRTLSMVITIVFLGPYGDQKNISGLRNPITFSIPIPPGVSDPVKVCEGETPVLKTPECGWLNTQTQQWVTTDCTTINLTATQVQCSCTHLTDFAFITPEFNHIPLEQLVDLSPESVELHPGGLITIMVVLVMFAGILVLSLRKDREEQRHFAELTTYKHAKWDREAAAVDPNFWTRWLKRFRIGLQTHHTWGSLLFRRSGTSFRSVDRAFVTLMLLLVLMSLSARFHARDQTFIGRVEIVIYSVLAAFFPNLLLAHLFRQTGEIGFYEKWQMSRGLTKPHKFRVLRYRFAERWRYVWYGMVLVCALAMIIYILSIALMFDQNPWYYCRGKATVSWIIDFITPYVITIFVVEPVKVATLVISTQLMQRTWGGIG